MLSAASTTNYNRYVEKKQLRMWIKELGAMNIWEAINEAWIWIVAPRKIKEQIAGCQDAKKKTKFSRMMILLLKFKVLCNTKAEISEENKIWFQVVTIIIFWPSSVIPYNRIATEVLHYPLKMKLTSKLQSRHS